MLDQRGGTWFSWVWRLQALYFVVTGIWPCLEIRSFQKISGPKTDLWLVKTVGVLVAVIGGVIGMAGIRRRITPEIAGLAIGSSAGLAAIDIFYSGRGRISRIYLLDALVEVLFIVAWAVGLRRQRRGI
jgi:hypothetical protein